MSPVPGGKSTRGSSIAHALEVVGERWTLLLVRDALLGVRRFDDFQASLGIATNVLTARLDHLVEAGLLRREPYCERPLRLGYVPTDSAVALWPVLLALSSWGGRHADRGGATCSFLHADCGRPLDVMAHCRHCHAEVPPPTAPSGDPRHAVGGERAPA
jgi:DNA-binding HxlR family transcriptional regulator